MKWQKLNPWNWFKHEENVDRDAVSLPVQQEGASGLPATDPFSSFWQTWQRQFDQMMQQHFRSLTGLPDGLGGFRPQLDLADEGEQYRISLETPGMSADDLAIRVDGDRLIIEGEKQRQSPQDQSAYYRMERYYGVFRRILSLPEDADVDRINASLRDGILELTIPRQAGVGSSRQIPIHG